MDKIKYQHNYTVSSFAEFINAVSEINKTCKKMIYRGQALEEWEISSSAYRELTDKKKGVYPSREMLMDYHVRLLKDIAKLPKEVDYEGINMLAYLQHIGAKTLLIDYTYNPLVALWFACSSHTEEKGAVYCLNNRDIFVGLTEIESNEKLKDLFDSIYEKTFLFEPSHLIQRITNQQSVFVLDLSRKTIKEHNIKITIPSNAKERIINELAVYGISRKTLFLDIDGFTEWFKYGKKDKCDELISEAEKLFKNEKYEEALETYRELQNLVNEIYGDESLETAGIYHSMAMVFYELKNYYESLTFHKKALYIREKFLDSKHLDIALSYHHIAKVFIKQGEDVKALEYYKKSLIINEKIFGIEHVNTATSYYNIAKTYYNQSEYKKALEYYEKALKRYNVTFREKHPRLKEILERIANIKSKLEQTDFSMSN